MWDNQYRQLEENEIIQLGDEVDMCNDGWRDVPKWVPATNAVGNKAPDPLYPSHRRFRRKVL